MLESQFNWSLTDPVYEKGSDVGQEKDEDIS